MIKIYGIKNCDSVAKALIMLKNENIKYEFLDLKSGVLDMDTLKKWYEIKGDMIINKASQTYKNLNIKAIPQNILDIALQNPTILKRPILVGLSSKSPLICGLKELEKSIGF